MHRNQKTIKERNLKKKSQTEQDKRRKTVKLNDKMKGKKKFILYRNYILIFLANQSKIIRVVCKQLQMINLARFKYKGTKEKINNHFELDSIQIIKQKTSEQLKKKKKIKATYYSSPALTHQRKKRIE